MLGAFKTSIEPLTPVKPARTFKLKLSIGKTAGIKEAAEWGLIWTSEKNGAKSEWARREYEQNAINKKARQKNTTEETMRLAVSAGESPAYGCGNGNIADDLYNKEENAA